MKKKYKYRKEFQKLAEIMGLEDRVVLTVQLKKGEKLAENGEEDPNSIKHELVNNGRRFLKKMMRMSLNEQALRLAQLKLKIDEAALDRAKFEAKQAEAANGNTDGQ